MIQAAGFNFQVVRVDPQQDRQMMDKGCDFMAKTHILQIRELAQHGVRNPDHGVAQIDHQCIRCQGSDILADFEDGRDDAHGVEKTAGPAILSIYLRNPELKRNLPILFPQNIPVAHFNGDDAEIGTPNSFFPVSCCLHAEFKLMLLDKTLRFLVRALKRVWIDVMQDDCAPLQSFFLENIPQGP